MRMIPSLPYKLDRIKGRVIDLGVLIVMAGLIYAHNYLLKHYD